MARRCEVCGKAPASGHNVSHSMRHTKRRFLPNIQERRMSIGGVERRVKICTRCLRSQYKSAV